MALVRSVRSTRSRVWFVAGALVFALALGYTALHLPPARRLALRLALGRLERSGIVARADTLDYNLAAFRFHLSGLTLATSATPSDPFFTAKDVQVKLTTGILSGRIVLKDVVLDEPRVALTRTQSGVKNWPGSPGGTSTFPPIPIEHARVTGLTFRWQDPQSSADVGVSFELTSNGGEAAGRIAATRPAQIAWREHRTTVQAIDGRVSWNGSDLGVGALALRLPEGALTADGRIAAVTNAARIDMHIVADADLAALAPWLDTGRAVSGASHADIRLTGALTRPDAVVAPHRARRADRRRSAGRCRRGPAHHGIDRDAHEPPRPRGGRSDFRERTSRAGRPRHGSRRLGERGPGVRGTPRAERCRCRTCRPRGTTQRRTRLRSGRCRSSRSCR